MKVENIAEDMGILIEELQKEWEQPKEIYRVLLIERNRVENMVKAIEELVVVNHKRMNNGNFSLRNEVRINKECYIFLRLATKMVEEYNRRDGEDFISLAMDKEEYALYKEYLKSIED